MLFPQILPAASRLQQVPLRLLVLCFFVDCSKAFLLPASPIQITRRELPQSFRTRCPSHVLGARRLAIDEDRCLYKELGVRRAATNEEIRKAFLILAKKHHPDVSEGADSLQRFQAISRAYEVLSDSETRKEYDTLTRFGGVAAAARGRAPPPQPRPDVPLSPTARKFLAGGTLALLLSAYFKIYSFMQPKPRNRRRR